MKLARFTIENFKRINYVEMAIEPKTNNLIITGENEQGKSATLEAIFAGFAGISSKAMPEPIKKGKAKATIQLVIDDGGEPLYIIERIITAKTERLVVRSPEGAIYPTPQALLNKIYDKSTIDVSAFLNLDAKKQLEQLKDVVNIDLDFDQLAEERKAIYDNRTFAKRELKEYQGQLAGIELPEHLPQKRIDISAQLKKQTTAQEKIQVNRAIRETLEDMKRKSASMNEELGELEEQLKEILADIKKQKEDIEIHKAAVKAKEEEVKKLRDPDIDAINAIIKDADRINGLFDEVETYKKLQSKIKAKEEEVNGYTNAIAEIDAKKENAFKEAKFPVKGLSFSDEGVLYNGVPFTQASSEEKIRVAMAIGMSKKPDVKLILIRDASLLDAKNLKVIQKIAEETGFLIIMERVDDSSPAAIVIEDGYLLNEEGEKIVPEEIVPEEENNKEGELF